MNLVRLACCLYVAVTALLVTACGGNCTAQLTCPGSGCEEIIVYMDTDGNTQTAYSVGAGREAIISNCKSIVSVRLADPNCCGILAKVEGARHTEIVG
jgi:hypothetical protein